MKERGKKQTIMGGCERPVFKCEPMNGAKLKSKGSDPRAERVKIGRDETNIDYEDKNKCILHRRKQK